MFWSKHRWAWFTWWFNHPPGKSICPKKDTYGHWALFLGLLWAPSPPFPRPHEKGHRQKLRFGARGVLEVGAVAEAEVLDEPAGAPRAGGSEGGTAGEGRRTQGRSASPWVLGKFWG